ncbi:MAG: NADPH:quinone reductase, partial [Thermoleophilia bacterium]|nr:NADPH:quinone reductase [Thermoleophilia bacterium]
AMGDLLRLWEHGLLRPVVGATFPLDRACDAHAALESRTSTGKLVLVP